MNTQKTLILGEKNWPKQDNVIALDFLEIDRQGLKLGTSRTLQVHDCDGNWLDIRGVLWRGQFDSDLAQEFALLGMIEASGVPCINSARGLRLFSDRISMHALLAHAGLPVVSSAFFLGKSGYGYYHEPDLPCVLKVGNWHMGYGKIKVDSKQQWLDAVDMAAISKDFIAVEPWIDYTADIRILVVGKEIIVIERIPSQWKANVCPIDIKFIEAPPGLVDQSRKAAEFMQMEILGVDWVFDRKGNWIVLEANAAPGLEFLNLDLRPLAMEMLKEKMRDYET